MGGAVVARVAEQPDPVDALAARTDAARVDATQASARPDHVAVHMADAKLLQPLPPRMRWIFGIAAALVAALAVSLALRPLGSYVNLRAVDGCTVYRSLLRGVLANQHVGGPAVPTGRRDGLSRLGPW
jgi:hypothetical protein